MAHRGVAGTGAGPGGSAQHPQHYGQARLASAGFLIPHQCKGRGGGKQHARCARPAGVWDLPVGLAHTEARGASRHRADVSEFPRPLLFLETALEMLK